MASSKRTLESDNGSNNGGDGDASVSVKRQRTTNNNDKTEQQRQRKRVSFDTAPPQTKAIPKAAKFRASNPLRIHNDDEDDDDDDDDDDTMNSISSNLHVDEDDDDERGDDMNALAFLPSAKSRRFEQDYKQCSSSDDVDNDNDEIQGERRGDDGALVTPFNMKQELSIGHFDKKTGSYVEQVKPEGTYMM
jgi:hypothetical protein